MLELSVGSPVRAHQKYYHNDVLYKFAIENSYFLPSLHALATIDLDMLDNDFQKFNKARFWFPNYTQFEYTIKVFRHIFDPVILGSKTLTLEQAIQRSEKGTSPGFQFQELGAKTRKDVFEGMLPLLKTMIQQINEGVDVKSIWKTAPKVEIRLLGKLVNEDSTKNKQRTFLVSDCLIYIVAMMLYGDQNDLLLSLACTHNWSAVGMSIFHGGWNLLAAMLTRHVRHKGRVRSYDISSMEASITPRLFELVYALRNAAIIGCDNMKRWVFKHTCYSEVIDVHGSLGQKIGCNASGGLNTLTDTTLVVNFTLLYHLVGKVMNTSDDSIVQRTVEHYEDLPVKNMGDDTIMADDPIWDGVEESSRELGIVMTEEHAPCHISQAKFLNFGFTYDHMYNMYIFKPNFDKLFANVFFNRKSNSWRLTLAKLYALRVLCYAFPARRLELEAYIALIWRERKSEVQQETFLDDKLPYNALKTMHLREDEVMFLLYGLESSIPQKLDTLSFIPRIRKIANELCGHDTHDL